MGLGTRSSNCRHIRPPGTELPSDVSFACVVASMLLTRELFASHGVRLSSTVVVNLSSQAAISHGQYFQRPHHSSITYNGRSSVQKWTDARVDWRHK